MQLPRVRHLVVPTMIVAMALLACKKKGAPVSETNAAAPTAPPAPTAPDIPPTPSGTVKLGAAVALDGVTVTAEEFKDCKLSNVYSRRTLTRAKEKLVGVNVLFEGNGEKEHNVSFTGFKVTDSEGMAFSATTRSGSDCSPTLKSGRIAKGEKSRGWVLFQVPEKMTVSKLSFTNRRPFRLRTPSDQMEQRIEIETTN